MTARLAACPRSRRPSRSRSTTGWCGSATPTGSTSPRAGATKLDLVEYYLAVGPGIVNALFERPCMLHRFPNGLAGDKVHQKRVPARGAAVAGDGAAALPALEPHGRRALRHRAGQRDLGGADVDRRVPPLEQPARGHREARRVAHRPRPGPAVRLRHGAARRRTSPTRCSTSSARSASPRPAAARGCTSTSGSRPTTASRTYAARRWPSPARSSGGRPRT